MGSMHEERLHDVGAASVGGRIMQRRKATLIAHIGISAFLQDKDAELLVAAGGGDRHCGLAVPAAAVIDIRTRLEQETARLDVSLLRGEQQRSETAFRARA